MVKNFLITGRPGIGKTTAVEKIVNLLKGSNVTVGGFVSREVRRGGARIGFEVEDVKTGKKGYLARVGVGVGPRVGKYTVNIREFEAIGVKALVDAIDEADVIIVDEIGPMELYSLKFKEAVRNAVESEKPVVATIHWKASRDPFCRAILSRNDVKIIELSFRSRDKVPLEVYSEIVEKLRE
ncbi:MAG: hypothetical protein B6U95_06915 [Thermofilum sp. ex4484_82]|nr:MAG: hypothetical protein B6U95_06915 [Thermofilum sp. ex4484_82]OYT37314.1 MAG: hypothetical protein B6U96_06910 [Archaeoglobales archaeon ex4484_92]